MASTTTDHERPGGAERRRGGGRPGRAGRAGGGPAPSRILAAAASASGGLGLLALLAGNDGGRDIVVEVQPVPVVIEAPATRAARPAAGLAPGSGGAVAAPGAPAQRSQVEPATGTDASTAWYRIGTAAVVGLLAWLTAWRAWSVPARRPVARRPQSGPQAVG